MTVRAARPVVSAAEREPSVHPFDGKGSEWDAFVRQAPGSTSCHLAGWREILTDVMGSRCSYLVATDGDGNWQGVLPMAHVGSRLFGRYLVSMPFLNYGGPLGTSVVQEKLGQAAAGEARRCGVDLLEIRSKEDFSSDMPLVSRKVTVILTLPDDEEALLGNFSAKLRSQIRRPSRDGMEPRFGFDQLAAFYDVFSQNMRDLGTPVLPRAFFERTAVTFSDLVHIGVIYLGPMPVAAGFGFVWNDEFEMTWASSLRAYNRQAPNMLLYWSFMKRMISLGVKAFNFGRCTPNSGTHRFKAQWGGSDVALPWRQWSSRGLSATPEPNTRLLKTASRVWSRFPLRLANRIGPLLARKLP